MNSQRLYFTKRRLSPDFVCDNYLDSKVLWGILTCMPQLIPVGLSTGISVSLKRSFPVLLELQEDHVTILVCSSASQASEADFILTHAYQGAKSAICRGGHEGY